MMLSNCETCFAWIAPFITTGTDRIVGNVAANKSFSVLKEMTSRSLGMGMETRLLVQIAKGVCQPREQGRATRGVAGARQRRRLHPRRYDNLQKHKPRT